MAGKRLAHTLRCWIWQRLSNSTTLSNSEISRTDPREYISQHLCKIAICMIWETSDHNMQEKLPPIFLHNKSYPRITNSSKSDKKLVLRMRNN